jgi:hypothetical protein
MELEKVLHTYQTLEELKGEGFQHVANNGGLWIMTDRQGHYLNYDPRTDQIIPFIEQREVY